MSERVSSEKIDRICLALADPEDGRDQGRGKLASRLPVTRRTVRRWTSGESECAGTAAVLVRQVADELGIE